MDFVFSLRVALEIESKMLKPDFARSFGFSSEFKDPLSEILILEECLSPRGIGVMIEQFLFDLVMFRLVSHVGK